MSKPIQLSIFESADPDGLIQQFRSRYGPKRVKFANTLLLHHVNRLLNSGLLTMDQILASINASPSEGTVIAKLKISPDHKAIFSFRDSVPHGMKNPALQQLLIETCRTLLDEESGSQGAVIPPIEAPPLTESDLEESIKIDDSVIEEDGYISEPENDSVDQDEFEQALLSLDQGDQGDQNELFGLDWSSDMEF